ncbi:MAG: GNAT family N-acetyltransferase [Spirochaetales bacterium]|nr:GNAT family N-acetyltransferase [Spirochaetales bacterium]
MKTQIRTYRHGEDFSLVREFLVKNYYVRDRPQNWGLERWNWGRYHPVMFSESDPDFSSRLIHRFETTIRLWENGRGELLGMVNTEWPLREGEAFIQRGGEADFLLPEMLDYIELSLIHPKKNSVELTVYDHDSVLIGQIEKRGYERKEKSLGHRAERSLNCLPTTRLTEGFSLVSMAEKSAHIPKRCELLGRGFDHEDRSEWTSPAEYEQVRKAPDYRPDLDLVVADPRGNYVSGCIAWYDEWNRIGAFEPVCTVPEYRRQGLGKTVMAEAMGRLKRLGAETVYVGSSLSFYQSQGFVLKNPSHKWVKRL